MREEIEVPATTSSSQLQSGVHSFPLRDMRIGFNCIRLPWCITRRSPLLWRCPTCTPPPALCHRPIGFHPPPEASESLSDCHVPETRQKIEKPSARRVFSPKKCRLERSSRSRNHLCTQDSLFQRYCNNKQIISYVYESNFTPMTRAPLMSHPCMTPYTQTHGES